MPGDALTAVPLAEAVHVGAQADASVFTAGLGEATTQTQRLCRSCLQLLVDERQLFFEGLARDGAAALGALQGCRSPFDVFAVEQAWLIARSRACVDTGLRLLETAVTGAPPKAGAPARLFVLPD